MVKRKMCWYVCCSRSLTAVSESAVLTSAAVVATCSVVVEVTFDCLLEIKKRKRK